MMYLGIEGRDDDLAHHNIYVTKNYRQNLDEIENQHVLSNDPSFYVQNASVTDSTLAPAATARCMSSCRSVTSTQTLTGTKSATATWK